LQAQTDWQKARHVIGRNEMCFKTGTGAAYLRPLWTGNLDLQSCPFGESCGCETSRDGPVSFFDISCGLTILTEKEGDKGDVDAAEEIVDDDLDDDDDDVFLVNPINFIQ
jgi:hypothetical protein